ncbi:hypothetical protein BRARA_I01963 [Brassica rapa]|uniref:Pectinesterase inhibitor domain-containing protein n=1 Tax=Brassica campestris TaxID=3711 RepID=A0A397Y320_BRACM|nr:hypothetical protein BRARA_I01963 [Brassica rapa]
MKFAVFFVMFFLFLICFTTAQTLIQDSCKKAAAKDPLFKYDFCVKSLETDPHSKAATNLKGLLIASTKNTESNTINILMDKKASHGIEIPLRDCIKLYTDGKDYLNQALKNVKSSDYRSASVHLSAALDAPTTCETGFKETIHKKSPVAKENKALFQKILIPLAFSNMI